jgi:uncharacterized protein (TIGR03084 family)
VDDILIALADQHAELAGIVDGCTNGDWERPTRCAGWDVAAVLVHLAATDELATASAQGDLDRSRDGFLGSRDTQTVSVDDAAAAQVDAERNAGGEAIRRRWHTAAREMRTAFGAGDPHHRVTWVSGQLSLQTLATTRLSECWIHTGDVADALGVALDPTPRLWHIARLAWRTLPYAFERDGRSLHGDVGVALDAPDGSRWEFVGQGEPLTRVEGPALDFCLVAGRRLDPPDSALVATGPDAEAVLALVRTYA